MASMNGAYFERCPVKVTYSNIPGRKFKEARFAHRIKACELAKEMKVSPSSLSTFENGYAAITYSMAERIIKSLKTLGADVSTLVNKPVDNHWSKSV